MTDKPEVNGETVAPLKTTQDAIADQVLANSQNLTNAQSGPSEVNGETVSPLETSEGMTNGELAARFNIPKSTIEKWAIKLDKGEPLGKTRHAIAQKLTRIDGKWFVND